MSREQWAIDLDRYLDSREENYLDSLPKVCGYCHEEYLTNRDDEMCEDCRMELSLTQH